MKIKKLMTAGALAIPLIAAACAPATASSQEEAQYCINTTKAVGEAHTLINNGVMDSDEAAKAIHQGDYSNEVKVMAIRAHKWLMGSANGIELVLLPKERVQKLLLLVCMRDMNSNGQSFDF